MKANKRFQFPTLITVLLSMLTFHGALLRQASAESLASVNGIPINSQHYFERYQLLLQTHPNAKGKKKLEDRLAKRALLPLVIEELLSQESKRVGLSLSSLTYEDPIIKLSEIYKTPDKLKEYLVRIGESELSLRQKKNSDVLIHSLMNHKGLLKVSEDELRDEYKRQENLLKRPEKVKVAQLLIKLPQVPTKEQINEAFQRIQEIHKLTTQEPFEVLVQRYSEGALKSRGGDIGFVSRGELLESIEQSIWSLKEGEISTPIRTKFGWHLMKRGGYQEAQTISFQEVRASLEEKLRSAKFRSGKRAYIKSLWSAAKIDSSLPLRY